uniref:Serum amyloid A protein n=1 Tax=Electrophorus electricus TaxID=8005 RepID=A0A4W4DRU9_ELEEL
MKLVVAALVLVLGTGAHAQCYRFPGKSFQGAADMWYAYSDNWRNSDKYIHACRNYDTAQRCPGGRRAAEVISDGREWIQNDDTRPKDLLNSNPSDFQ